MKLYENKSYEKSYALALEITKKWPDYPEAYFILWKMASKTPSRGIKWGEKYISHCDRNGKQILIKYELDPFICSNYGEVVSKLKVEGVK